MVMVPCHDDGVAVGRELRPSGAKLRLPWAGQAIPHWPQLEGSVVMSTQPPLQLVVPVGHWSTQAPWAQSWAEAQATAQSLGVGLVRIWAGIGTVLAIRLLLLLSILGAFALAWLAMEYRDIASLCVLIAYAVLVVLPMVYLSRFNRADSRGE